MIEEIKSPYIHAANSENFAALVLENSQHGPVLVNFWSRKAGPSLRQYPVLDQVIHHYGGRMLLVNIDTEQEFVYTRQYAVTSVPMLKLFRYGQVVETWRGYQSESDLTKVLDRYVARDSDQALAAAIQLYTRGETAAAYEKIAAAIVDDPVNPRLPLAMCKLLKHEQRYDDALRLIQSLPEEIRADTEINQLHAVLTFCIEAEPTGDEAALRARLESNPSDLAARRQLVARHVLHQQYEPALVQLAAILELDAGYANGYAQHAMRRIFTLLGAGHPLLSQYRPLLQRYTL